MIDWRYLLNVWVTVLAIYCVLLSIFNEARFVKIDKLSCIRIIHLGKCAFHFSIYVIAIVYIDDAAAELQNLNTFWTFKYVIIWGYSLKYSHTQALVTSFSSVKSHWRYSHSSEMCFSPSWQYKVCVECVFGRWVVHIHVWNKWCHALKLI